MSVKTVADWFSRDRRSDRTVLVDETGRSYDAHWVITTAWKAGNFLRHTGIRRGVTVGVAGRGPIPLLAFFGTTLLEGTTWFDPPRSLASNSSVRTVVASVDAIDEYDLAPGTQRVGYGGRPDDPSVHALDPGLWSENPSFPPISIDPETTVLTDGARTYDHHDVLSAARAVATKYDVDTGAQVRVRGPLSDPRTVVAGIVAPLVGGGVIVLDEHASTESSAGASAEPTVIVEASGDTNEAIPVIVEEIALE